MNLFEFKNQFDILYNQVMSNAAPNLDDYEVSYFLSKAQKELIIEIYNGSFNSNSFEQIEENRQYINHLIKDYRTSQSVIGNGISTKSTFYNLPNDVWFRIYESVDFGSSNELCDSIVMGVTVMPVTHDEYHVIKRNPFRRQSDRRVLRLDYNDNTVELVSNYPISSYQLRYLAMPSPIILVNLTGGLSIDGVTEMTECQLNNVFHEIILNRAVDLAKFAWQGAANSKV